MSDVKRLPYHRHHICLTCGEEWVAPVILYTWATNLSGEPSERCRSHHEYRETVVSSPAEPCTFGEDGLCTVCGQRRNRHQEEAMMSKSYVTLEQAICPVCGCTHDTGNLLLDKRLRERFEMHTTTGWAMCPEHQEKKDQGYVALVECDPKKSGNPHAIIQLEDAYRTGQIVHVRSHAFEQIFGQKPPEGMLVFIEPEVTAKLQEMMEGAQVQEMKQ